MPEVMIPQVTNDYAAHVMMMTDAVKYCKATRALEIGTDVGDSARIFATALRETNGTLLSIDKREVDKTWAKDYPNIQFTVADSTQMPFNTEIDFLFIDGDHAHDVCLSDLKKFGVWVRQGGIILVHDTRHTEFGDGITKAIREFCLLHQLRWMEDVNPHGMGLIEVTHALAH